MASENGSFSGGSGGFAPDFLKKMTLAKIANGPGASQNQAYAGAPIQELLKAYQETGGSNMARMGGFDIVPYMNGTFAVNRAGVPGMGASQHNDTPYDIYDAQGNYLGSNTWKDLGTDGVDKIVDGGTKALTAAFIGGGVLGGFGIGPMASSGAGATGAAGAVGTTAADIAAAEMAAGAGLGPGAALGAEAVAAYGSLASPSLQAMASAMGMSPEAFAALGAGGVGAAGAAAGMGAGTTAATTGGSSGFNLGNIFKGIAGSGAGGFDWGSLVGPALSAGAGIYGASQTGKAADAQVAAAQQARADMEPWRQAGVKGLNRLMEELGIGGDPNSQGYGRSARDFGMSDFQADPGYAFRQAEQQKALERKASANGGLWSGGAIKDAMRYSGDLASQEYGRAFDRFQVSRTNRLNPLQSIAGQGQSAANMVGEYGTQAGNAQAAGRIGQANAITGALTQGYGMYANQQQQNQNNALMQAILAGRA